MAFFKSIMIDAENCGFAGMASNNTYTFLKDKYSWADFDGEDFRYNGPIYLAWEAGYIEYLAEVNQ